MKRVLFVAGAALAMVAAMSPAAYAAPAPPAQSTADTARPAGVHAPKGRPPIPGAAELRQSAAAGTLQYFYANAYQYASANGARADLTIAKPFLSTNDSHTLTEIAVQSADGRQIVEVGWTVDRGQFGDSNPHLFVFHWIDGAPTCYNGCGFVAYDTSVPPGMALPLGTRAFGIQHYQGNWWISYDGRWVGYYPGSRWGGGYTKAGLVQWFGEVAAFRPNPTTDMGNGRYASSTSAARINQIGFYGGPAVSFSTDATNAGYYSIKQINATAVRYGGTGAG